VVLVADDERNVRFPIVQFLKQHGFHVLEADDGQQAVALAAEHVPDVILLDARMPRLTGPQAARIIGSRAELAHIPIILMSGSEPPQVAHAAGCVEFLPKPYSPMAMVAVVAHWAQHGKSG
jgi:CheY-like chemotaxis protein